MNAYYTSIAVTVACLSIGTALSPWTQRPVPERTPDPYASPGHPALDFAGLEHSHGWADLAWLKAIQHIGGGEAQTDPHHFARIASLTHIATDLDPRYDDLYFNGATYISAYSTQADLSDDIVLKGQSRLPREWRMPFMLGWNDYFIRGNGQDAAEHWKRAALLPNAPAYLGSLSGRALRQATGDAGVSIEFLTAMLEHVADPRQRKSILGRIAILESEPILEAYDVACQQYYASEGTYPDGASTLFLMGAVPYPPKDKLGSLIRLDTSDGQCVARSAIIKMRESEASQRLGSFGDTPNSETAHTQVSTGTEEP